MPKAKANVSDEPNTKDEKEEKLKKKKDYEEEQAKRAKYPFNIEDYECTAP